MRLFAGRKAAKKRGVGGLIGWIVGSDGSAMQVPGYTRLIDCPEVAAAVDAIAGSVSSMTIHLMENTKAGDVRVRDALATKVDINPYGLTTRKTWIEWIVRTMLTAGDGNAFVLPVTTNGYLDDLMPMPDATAQPVGDSYVVQWRGRSFAPDEVLHFVLHPDLTYPWRGTGYRVQLRDVAAGLKQAAATKKGFMSEKWKPSIIVRVDGIAEEFAGKEGRRKFLDDYLSTDEAGEPWVVQADLMDVQQIKPLSLQDLAINDAVTLDKRTVASVMHVPAFLLGVGDYDQDAYNNYVRSTVMEIATAIQQELTKKLLLSPSRYFRLNPRSLYAYSMADLSSVACDLYVRGLMTGNEARDWLGMTPKKDLDQLVMLENYIPAGMIGDQKKLIQDQQKEGTDA